MEKNCRSLPGSRGVLCSCKGTFKIHPRDVACMCLAETSEPFLYCYVYNITGFPDFVDKNSLGFIRQLVYQFVCCMWHPYYSSVFIPSPQLEKVLQQGDIGECAEPYMILKEADAAKVILKYF